MRPTPSRLVAGGAIALLVAAALAGCAPAGAVGGCTPTARSGEASGSVTATGDFGKAPTVDFTRPLHPRTTEVSTLIPGRGDRIGPAQQVVADITFLDGTTGEVLTQSEYSGNASAARFVVRNVPVKGLSKALVCAQRGERLAAVIPPSEGIQADSRPPGLDPSDSIVAVVDVRQAFLARAEGRDQVMAGGLPAVVLGPDGRPGITLPEGDPPTTLQAADLKTGTGAVVRRGDTVVVQYTGVLWNPEDSGNGTVFQSSWADGEPQPLPVERGQIVPGLVRALAGRHVGSQVLAVLPPAQAYGDQGSGSVPPGSTLVFVVDILGKA